MYGRYPPIIVTLASFSRLFLSLFLSFSCGNRFLDRFGVEMSAEQHYLCSLEINPFYVDGLLHYAHFLQEKGETEVSLSLSLSPPSLFSFSLPHSFPPSSMRSVSSHVHTRVRNSSLSPRRHSVSVRRSMKSRDTEPLSLSLSLSLFHFDSLLLTRQVLAVSFIPTYIFCIHTLFCISPNAGAK
jgi:hypothetical protein